MTKNAPSNVGAQRNSHSGIIRNIATGFEQAGGCETLRISITLVVIANASAMLHHISPTKYKHDKPIKEAKKWPKTTFLGCAKGESGAAMTKNIEAPNDPIIIEYSREKAKKPKVDPARKAPKNETITILSFGNGGKSSA